MSFMIHRWSFLALLVVDTKYFCLENCENDFGTLKSSVETKEESVPWGLHDVTISTGVMFQYNIARILPFGKNTQFKLSEVNSSILPSWLEFCNFSCSLIGVANPDDVGKLFYIKVIYENTINRSSIFKDVFGISIVEHSPYLVPLIERSLGTNTTVIKCSPGLPITYATILIDVPLDALLPSGKVHLFKTVAQYFGVSVSDMRILSARYTSLIDNRILVAGPGDVIASFPIGTWLQWKVGCGNVNPNNMPILEKLQNTSQNGNLSRLIGHGIVGWHVINIKPMFTTRLKRYSGASKRYSYASMTPVYALEQPKQIVGTPTTTITDSKRNDTSQTRIVASISSPLIITYNNIKSSKSFETKSTNSLVFFRKLRTSDPIEPTMRFTSDEPIKIMNVSNQINLTTIVLKNTDLEPSIVVVNKATATIPTARLEKKNSMLKNNLVKVSPSNRAATTRVIDNPAIMVKKSDALAPTINFEIGTLFPTVGRVFSYKIPDSLFSDSIDGGTVNLNLVLLNSDSNNVNSWISLNTKTQTIVALPLRIYREQYFLSATNSLNKSTKLGFHVDVKRLDIHLNINFVMNVVLEAVLI